MQVRSVSKSLTRTVHSAKVSQPISICADNETKRVFFDIMFKGILERGLDFEPDASQRRPRCECRRARRRGYRGRRVLVHIAARYARRHRSQGQNKRNARFREAEVEVMALTRWTVALPVLAFLASGGGVAMCQDGTLEEEISRFIALHFYATSPEVRSTYALRVSSLLQLYPTDRRSAVWQEAKSWIVRGVDEINSLNGDWPVWQTILEGRRKGPLCSDPHLLGRITRPLC